MNLSKHPNWFFGSCKWRQSWFGMIFHTLVLFIAMKISQVSFLVWKFLRASKASSCSQSSKILFAWIAIVRGKIWIILTGSQVVLQLICITLIGFFSNFVRDSEVGLVWFFYKVVLFSIGKTSVQFVLWFWSFWEWAKWVLVGDANAMLVLQIVCDMSTFDSWSLEKFEFEVIIWTYACFKAINELCENWFDLNTKNKRILINKDRWVVISVLLLRKVYKQHKYNEVIEARLESSRSRRCRNSLIIIWWFKLCNLEFTLFLYALPWIVFNRDSPVASSIVFLF